MPDYAEAGIILPKSKFEDIKKLADGIKVIKIEEKEDSLVVKAFGISAHGSTPELGKNVISHLLLFLGKLVFEGDTKEFLEFMNEYIGLYLNGESIGIYLEDEISGKLIFNLGVILVSKEEINLQINMRYPLTK